MKRYHLGILRISLCALLLIIPISALASNTLELPSDLKIIEAEAFMGDTSIDIVLVPDGVKEIRSKAFAGSSVWKIVLPNSVESIASDAFSNTEVMAVAEEGSYAAKYFREHQLPLEIDPVVSGVVIEEGNVTLYPGESMTLHANVLAKGEAKLGVGWTTGAPDVVTITHSGDIQAVKPGTAIIYATSIDDIAYTTAIVVTVKEASTDVYQIKLEPASLTLTQNETATLRALVPEAFKNGEDILWASSDPGIVYVSSLGIVAGVSEGSAIIHASLKDHADIFAECNVLVEKGLNETDERDFEYVRNAWGECIITQYIGNEQEVVIPRNIGGHTVTGIGIGDNEYFHYKKFSIGLIIPDTVLSINKWAFFAPQEWEDFGSIQYISTPGYPIEKYCYYLPDSIQSIGECAFSGQFIKEIHLPKNLTSLGSGAFEEAFLYHIELPDSLLTIPKFAFEATQLKHVDFPANLQSIGLAAFEYCHNLTEVVLPSSVTTIADRAFNGCSSLKKIYVPATASYESQSFPSSADIITYYGDKPPVDGPLTMSAEDIFMGVGMETAPKLTCSDGVDRSSQVTLTCSDPEVATVSNGRITAVGTGDARVTAEIASMDLCVSFTVRVRTYISPASSLSLRVGETQLLKNGWVIVINGDDGDNLSLSTSNEQWSSSNTKVATVDNKGKVTAVGKGEATIMCKLTDSGVYSTCKVNVTGELKLTLESETWNLGYGETVQVDAKLTGGKGTKAYKAVDSKGEPSTVVSINTEGLITAGKKEGTAIIYVTATVGDQTLEQCHEIYVWGAWSRKGFSWEEIKKRNENNFNDTILPKWKSAWEKIEYNNDQKIKDLENTIDTEIQVVPDVDSAFDQTLAKQFLTEFKKSLAEALNSFDYDLLDYSEYSGKEKKLFEDILHHLIDNPDAAFEFTFQNVKYAVVTDSSSINMSGAAQYKLLLTGDNGKKYTLMAYFSSPAKIALAMENMKGLFVKEYNNLAETVKSGTLDMVGVNKIKDYVQKWIKGKAVDHLNVNGKRWMENFGTRMKDMDTIRNDVKGLEGFDLKDTQPKNVVNSITKYQNKVVKFINDVLALGDCP